MKKITLFRILPLALSLLLLGTVAMAAFSIQVLTGIVLLVYYVPHQDHAHRSWHQR